MAIVLEANYAKKLGLPNYSSHQYCVTIRTELTDLAQVEAESARLYALLQTAVDREIQEVGFMPDASRYGMHPPQDGNGHPHHVAVLLGQESQNHHGAGFNPRNDLLGGDRGLIAHAARLRLALRSDILGESNGQAGSQLLRRSAFRPAFSDR